MTAPTPTPDPTEAALRRVVDTVGGLMELWGFRRALGRMWASLYLAPSPLTAQELAERLTLSAGAISTNLQELVEWGVVKKTLRPGDRKDYFEPETSIWKMVSRVFRERELARVRQAIELFQTALADLAPAVRAARADEKRRLAFARDRVESLLGLARIGEGMLEAILAGRRVDASPIARFFSGGS